MIGMAEYPSPMGTIYIAADEECVVGLWLEGQKYFAGTLRDMDVRGIPLPALSRASDWLDRYFSGQMPDPAELTLCPEGTRFRRIIWEMLLEIPYGETVTYRDLALRAAAALGKERMSARAVGGAVGHNPISLIIPCHRVVGSDGSLTGYAAGPDKKEFLLNFEKKGQEKKALRELFRKRRRELPDAYRSSADDSIRLRLKQDPIYDAPGVLFTYVSAGDEVDTRKLIAEALAAGKSIRHPGGGA